MGDNMAEINTALMSEIKKISSKYNSSLPDLIKRSQQLISRGVTDDCIIAGMVEHELKNGIKAPKKLRAEMYDKMNYMCRRYMDRIARFELDYDHVPDVEALKNVIIAFLESAPVFHSRFVDNHIAPYWRVADYHIDDVFSAVESDDFEKSSDEFLLRDIDVKNNVQIFIALFYKNGKSKLSFMWNHMIMDGGDLKHVLDDLFRNYNNYKSEKRLPVDFRIGTRSYKAVYGDMSTEDQKTAKKLFANVSSHDKHSLPFTQKSESDRKILVRKKVSAEIFEPARLKAKSMGATVNDLISAAYLRAFYEVSGCPQTEQVGISCAVDLRRYIKSIEKTGYTNHTTFMPCVVESMGADMNETLISVTQSTAKVKSDKFMGLHGLPLLNIGYSTMIYAQAEFVVGLFYNNANLAVSNVGAMDVTAFSMDGNAPVGAAVAGAAKNKPCSMMTALTLNGELALSICINGNDDDKKMLQRFFDGMESNLASFTAQ